MNASNTNISLAVHASVERMRDFIVKLQRKLA